MSAPALDVARLRSWLFVDGADEAALAAAPHSAGDVLIQELEDFTPPPQRPRARAIAPGVLAAWRAAGRVAAVRINPLPGDAVADLDGVMAGAPQVVLLPKCESPEQVRALDAAVTVHESRLGLAPGSTALVPNVETARGLLATFAIATASPRVVGCLVASEDMAASWTTCGPASTSSAPPPACSPSTAPTPSPTTPAARPTRAPRGAWAIARRAPWWPPTRP